MSTNPHVAETRPVRRAALRVALVYAGFASAWILLSDRILGYFVRDAAHLVVASTFKGWFFVLLTSALLYGLVARMKSGPGLRAVADSPGSRAAWALALAASLAIAGLATLLVHRQEAIEARHRMDLFTHMKASELALWLRERDADARFLESSTFFGDLLHRWHAGDTGAARALHDRLDHFRTLKNYESVLLVGPDGRIALALGRDLPLDPARLAAEVRRTGGRHARLVDLAPADAPHASLDTIAMLLKTPRGDDAALVLRSDPEGPSLDMLREPGPDGANALLLRHDERGVRLVASGAGAAFDPAALRYVADHGEETEEMALDRRGQPSLVAQLAALPDPDLRLVGFAPADRLYAEATLQSAWTGLSTGIMLFAGLAGMLLLRQSQRLRLEALRQREQAERLHALELLDTIVDASSDAIFAKDRDGRYLLYNTEVERITGKGREAALGHDDTFLFPPDQAGSIRANDERVMREGRNVAFEETVTTVAGERHYLATKGPLREADGSIFGIFGISRDITARREAEEERRRVADRLLESERLMRLFVENAPAAIAMLDRQMRYVVASRRWLEDYHLGDVDLTGRSHYDVFPEVPDRWRDVHARALEGHVERCEGEPFPRRDGRVDFVRWEVRPWYDAGGAIGGIIVATEDITARHLAEIAVLEGRARLDLALEAANLGTWRHDLATGRVELDARAVAIFGTSSGELAAEAFLPRVHPEDAARVEAEIGAAIDGRDDGRLRMQYRYRHPDGAERWIDARGQVEFRDGDPAFIAGTAMDVTASKAAEEEVRRNERRWIAALEAAGHGVWDWDMRSGTVIRSAAWNQIVGYGDEPVTETLVAWRDLVHPDDRAAPDGAMQRHLRGETETYRAEYRLRARDGSWRWILDQGTIVARGPDGAPLRMLGTHTDVTWRREITDRLAENEALYRSMVTALHEGVMIFSRDNVVLAANAAAERILRQDAATISATHRTLDSWRAVREDGSAFPGAELPVARALFEGSSQQGVSLGIVQPTGETTWLLVNAEPIRDASGTVTSAVVSFTDVTSRRAAEIELARHREMLEQAVADRTAQLGRSVAKLESFNYTISHDLRAPLRAINGYASMLAEDAGTELSEENRRLLGRIGAAAQRMDDLLEDIHQYSKSDRAELVPVEIDLEELAREVVEQLRPPYPGTRIDIGPLPRVHADATTVRQVFSNLVANALKFSAHAPHPHVVIRCEDWGGERAFAVSDNGAGFDMRYVNQLFGMFKRLHREAEFPGTGVGLAIVRNVVERHGGRIAAEGEPGRGATFRFTLGAASGPAPEPAVTAPTSAACPSPRDYASP